MLLLVSDACILIDIEQGKLTDAMFSLPYQFAVPDILYAEELAERHQHLLQLGLISEKMKLKKLYGNILLTTATNI